MSSSSPSPPLPTIIEFYTHLTSIVQSSTTSTLSTLEIDILPSSYPTQILYEHPALALPKPLLRKLYLHARAIFFDKNDGKSAHSSSSSLASVNAGDDLDDARLKATTVLLLFDPNHLTAANYRKRYIQSLHDGPTPTMILSSSTHTARRTNQPHLNTINHELHLLTSLLTSPLSKHAKSSTLWFHRLWLFRHFYPQIVQLHPSHPSSSSASSHPLQKEKKKNTSERGERLVLVEEKGGASGATNDICASDKNGRAMIWDSELPTILQAAARHPRNYYAWNYARELYHLLFPSPPFFPASPLLLSTLPQIHKWCLLHPRDVSGWAFLGFVMRQINMHTQLTKSHENGGKWYRKDEVVVGAGLGMIGVGVGENAIKQVIWETEEWVRKYEWRGESVEGFLRGRKGEFPIENATWGGSNSNT